MKIHVYDIKYSEKTREWNVSLDNLAGWKQYSEDPKSDKSIWTFGNFMEMGSQLPTEMDIDVPFDDLVLHLDEIDAMIKKEIKRITTREASGYKIAC